MIWIWTLPLLSCVLSVHSLETETFSCIFGNFYGFGKNEVCHLQNLTMTTAQSINYTDTDELKNKVKKIFIGNGKLNQVPEKLFLNYKNMIDVEINDCGVTEITTESFKSATNLQSLSLLENKIVSLNSNIFNDCGNVTTLLLVRNLIEHIDSDVFQPIVKLQYLELSNNRIKSVDTVIFSSLSFLGLSFNLFEEFNGNNLNVSGINLQYNLLKSLKINGNCKEMYADNNQISKIFVDEENVLETVQLQNNSLTDLRNISKCTKLLKLHLSKNDIQVKSDTFSGLSNLTFLDISGNNRTIDSLNFLKPIQSLDFLVVQLGVIVNYSFENVVKMIPNIRVVSLFGGIDQNKIVYNPGHVFKQIE